MPLCFHSFVSHRTSAVIAGENEQGVLVEPVFFEGLVNLTYYPVHLHQEITVRAEPALACKLFHWCPRLVWDRRSVVQKERSIRFILGMILNDFYCPFDQRGTGLLNRKTGGSFGFHSYTFALDIEFWKSKGLGWLFGETIVFDPAHRIGSGGGRYAEKSIKTPVNGSTG